MRKARLLQRLGFLKVLVPAIAFIASLPGVLSYFPRISVDPSSSIRPDATATNFIVTNGGLMKIHDVHFGCIFPNLKQPNGNSLITNIEFVPYLSDLGNVSPGKQATAPCSETVATQAKSGFILKVHLSYRASFTWWRINEVFPFSAEQNPQGAWVWQPVSEGGRKHVDHI